MKKNSKIKDVFQMCNKSIKLVKIPIIVIILFLLSFCEPFDMNSIRLPDNAYVKMVDTEEYTPQASCEQYPDGVKFPSSLSSNPRFKNWKRFAYCIKFDISNPEFFHEKKMGLDLGYIDNLPVIYLNGELLYKSEPELEYYNYEKHRIFSVSGKFLKENNFLEIYVEPLNFRENGMGIYAGNIYMDELKNIEIRDTRLKFYNISKVVLFFGTSLLFFTLFLGRKREVSYLFFSLFLFSSSIYFFTKLELKYDIGINLFLMKKFEYISLSMIMPLLNFFLLSILNVSIKNYISTINVIFIITFSGVFLFTGNVVSLDEINHIYHIPVVLFSLFLSIVLVITEIFRNNKRSLPIFFILLIPFILSLFHILNSSFLFLPEIMNFSLGGDSILILVVCMTIYVAIGFYKLQKNLDFTIQKEEFLRKTFQLYVPPKDLATIMKGSDQGFEMIEIAENKKMIILFCDIRDFTSISEKMNPEELVKFLNDYFTYFNSIIIDKGGVIDKLIGDCIMARFDEEDNIAAIETALLMRAHLKKWNVERKKNRQKIINHGIGLAMGNVVVGNIGSVNKMDYTVIGDSVNLASRLESLTKFYGIDILVSDNLYRSTKKEFYFREIDKIKVVGKSKITRVYQPLGIKKGIS